jgi:hypothetical protein
LVALEEPEIASCDPNIPIDNNCTDEELHFRIPGGDKGYDNQGDDIDESDALPTSSRPRWPAIELEGLTWEQVMWIGMRVIMATVCIQMRRMKHCKLMIG